MKKFYFLFLMCVLILSFGCKGKEKSEESEPLVNIGYVTVEDGIQLHYKTIGNGPQVVIIPAGMYLEYEFERLANKGRTLIFYDPRSRGRSSRITDPSRIGMDFEISDMEAIRKHFNKDKISLVGWSYLGAIVVLYSSMYPEYVERVIQIGPLPPSQEISAKSTLNPVDKERQASLQQMRKQGTDKSDPERFCRAYWETYMTRMFCDPSKINQFRSEYYKFPNELPDNVNFQFMGLFKSFGKWDWRERVQNLNVPVLTIQGDHDTIPMEGARTWVSSLPNARLLVIPNAGHFPFVEDPELFHTAVDTFLRGEWPDRSEVVGVAVH